MSSLVSDKAIKFIGKFLTWYQDSYSLPDVVNKVKLEELVKEAEEVHVQRIKEIYDQEIISNLKSIPPQSHKKRPKAGSVRRRKISRYL